MAVRSKDGSSSWDFYRSPIPKPPKDAFSSYILPPHIPEEQGVHRINVALGELAIHPEIPVDVKEEYINKRRYTSGEGHIVLLTTATSPTGQRVSADHQDALTIEAEHNNDTVVIDGAFSDWVEYEDWATHIVKLRNNTIFVGSSS